MKQTNTARRQRYWDLRAAGNFIGGGSGTGLVIAAALAALLGQDITLPVLAGIALVAMGLSLVWLEIGKPWRAFNVFFHPQTSWMTREGILAGPLLASSAAAVWWDSTALLAVAAVLAAGFLYCQARMLRASRAIPAWSHPRTVPLILLTGLTEGAGLFLLFGTPTLPLISLALAAALGREIAREAYRRGLIAARAPEGTLSWFQRKEVRLLQALRLLAIVLLALGLIGLSGVAVVGGVLAAVTGWAFKVILITRAAYTRGARIPHTPVRGRGVSRVVDTA